MEETNGRLRVPIATGAILARLKGIPAPLSGRNNMRKKDVNPLLPFTYVDLMYIIGQDKKKASVVAENNAGGRCSRRGNARSTPSNSSVPALTERGERLMDIEKEKARELADRGRCVENPDGTWFVFSLTSPNKYKVILNGMDPKTGAQTRHSCTCPSFELNQDCCKHIRAVLSVRQQDETDRRQGKPPRDRIPDGEPVVYPRKTYKQDWPNYDLAQQVEESEFRRLLADLCGTLPPPATQKGTKGGNATASLSDVIFASVYKIYSGKSGRRFATAMSEARESGYVSRALHHSTIARCLESEETTPILTGLIEASALPFKAIEKEFAVDSSGFSACKFDRWYDAKYGRMHAEHSWVKAHVMTGTTTQAVTSVIIEEAYSGDAPNFPPLVKATAKGFTVKQVSGDKAYSTVDNFQAVEDVGGTGYLAFKLNTTGAVGGVYERMYHLFCLNKEDYLAHYHRRSNVESVFSAVKRLFGDSVRSKNERAMRNEVLGKLLAYNITLLVHAIYELRLEPQLGAVEANDCPAILPFIRQA